MAISQKTQVRRSEEYVATLDPTQAEIAPTSLQDDLNYLRTLLRLISDPAGDWFDIPPINLAAIAADTTPADFIAHAAATSIHFTQAAIDHTVILNRGANTHAQIDTHIARTDNPHSLTPASIGAAALVHLHTVSQITDYATATDTRIVTHPAVVANTAKVSADGSISTHSDVDTEGLNVPLIGDVLFWDGLNWRPTTPGSGSEMPLGDVSGPGMFNSTDNAIARWDGNTGRLVQDSNVNISDHVAGLVDLYGGLGITLSIRSDVARPLYLRHASTAAAIEVGPTAVSGITLHSSVAPDPVGTIRLGTTTAGGRFDNILSKRFTLEDGLATPSTLLGFSQLFMDGSEHVSVRKSSGTIVDLETTGSGDVVGPGSSTDYGFPLFDGITGKLLRGSNLYYEEYPGDGGILRCLDGQLGINSDQTEIAGDISVTVTSNGFLYLTANTNVNIWFDGDNTDLDNAFSIETSSGTEVYARVDKTSAPGVFQLLQNLAVPDSTTSPAALADLNQIFVNSATGELSVRKSIAQGGGLISLETGGSGGSSLAHESFTPTLGQTIFTIAQPSVGRTIVFINGQEFTETNDFTVVGTTLTWLPLQSGITLDSLDNFDVYYEV